MSKVQTDKKALMEYMRSINGHKVEGLDLFVSTLIEDIERAHIDSEEVDYTRALTCLHFEAVD